MVRLVVPECYRVSRPAEDSDSLVEGWLTEVVRHPLETWELGPAYNPADPHQDPEFALRLQADGVPVWWPSHHPRTREKLSPARRRAFFLAWLCGVWDISDRRLLRGAQGYRRRRLAIELLYLQMEISEAWQQLPWDESL